jgi:hypothetical protein
MFPGRFAMNRENHVNMAQNSYVILIIEMKILQIKLYLLHSLHQKTYNDKP